MHASVTHAACYGRLPANRLHPHGTHWAPARAVVPAPRPVTLSLYRKRRAATTVRAKGAAQTAPSDAPKPRGVGQQIRGLLQLLPSAKCVSVLQLVAQLLRKHLWAVVIIYAVKDALQFLLHRVTHRLTNYAAEVIFKYPIGEEVINAWWLVLDQEFLQQYPGYQVVMGALFLVAMPLNLLLSATASASTILLCAPQPHPSPASPPAATPDSSTAPPSAPSTSDGASSSSGGAAGAPEPDAGQEATAPALSSASGAAAASSSTSTGTASPAAITAAAEPSTSSSSAPAGAAAAGDGQAPGSESSTSEATTPAEAAPGAPVAVSSAGDDTPGSSSDEQGASSSSSSTEPAAAAGPQKRGWFAPLRRGWQEALEPLPKVGGMLRRVWWTETVVSVIGLALQAGMMLVVTVPWLLPIYLSAQLAGVTSVKLGDWGLKAINSSSELMKGRKRVVFWPLLALLLAARLVDQVKVAAFAAMPQRFWAEAVEVPLAAYVLLQALRIIASRMQDLLPVGLYLHLLQEQEAEQAAATS